MKRPTLRRSALGVAFATMLFATSLFGTPASAACVYHNIGYDCEQGGYIMFTGNPACDPESYIYPAPPPPGACQ